MRGLGARFALVAGMSAGGRLVVDVPSLWVAGGVVEVLHLTDVFCHRRGIVPVVVSRASLKRASAKEQKDQGERRGCGGSGKVDAVAAGNL